MALTGWLVYLICSILFIPSLSRFTITGREKDSNGNVHPEMIIEGPGFKLTATENAEFVIDGTSYFFRHYNTKSSRKSKFYKSKRLDQPGTEAKIDVRVGTLGGDRQQLDKTNFLQKINSGHVYWKDPTRMVRQFRYESDNANVMVVSPRASDGDDNSSPLVIKTNKEGAQFYYSQTDTLTLRINDVLRWMEPGGQKVIKAMYKGLSDRQYFFEKAVGVVKMNQDELLRKQFKYFDGTAPKVRKVEADAGTDFTVGSAHAEEDNTFRYDYEYGYDEGYDYEVDENAYDEGMFTN